MKKMNGRLGLSCFLKGYSTCPVILIRKIQNEEKDRKKSAL